MKPPDPEESARHLPTPTQRCTAVVRSPSSSANAKPACRGSGAAAGRRRSASSGRGRTSTPGLSRSAGSSRCLNAPNAASASGEYITGSSSLRARPSPCSPDSDPPCAATRCAASVRNWRMTPGPPGRSSGKSIRTWMQPSPKCP